MSKTDPMIVPGGHGCSPEELSPEARMRLEHAGRWMAPSVEGRRIVTAGDGPDAVRDAAARAGVARSILDRVRPIEGCAADA